MVFCGITCLANVDADEISKSFERGPDGPGPPSVDGQSGEINMNAYEPPLPVPSPTGSILGAHDDVSVNLEGGSPTVAAYGTFTDRSNSPINKNVNVPGIFSVDGDVKEDEIIVQEVITHSHLLPTTTIDADID